MATFPRKNTSPAAKSSSPSSTKTKTAKFQPKNFKKQADVLASVLATEPMANAAHAVLKVDLKTLRNLQRNQLLHQHQSFHRTVCKIPPTQ